MLMLASRMPDTAQRGSFDSAQQDGSEWVVTIRKDALRHRDDDSVGARRLREWLAGDLRR